MTRNTSMSLTPAGWLIAGPVILATAGVFLAAYVAGLLIIEIVKLTVKLIRLAVLTVRRQRYHPAHR
jgi:hypothetical protein